MLKPLSPRPPWGEREGTSSGRLQHLEWRTRYLAPAERQDLGKYLQVPAGADPQIPPGTSDLYLDSHRQAARPQSQNTASRTCRTAPAVYCPYYLSSIHWIQLKCSALATRVGTYLVSP